MKGILPLAIQLERLVKTCNKDKENLDENDLEDNINQVAKLADLSPNQIDSLKAKQGKSKRKSKVANTSSAAMLTRSHTSKVKSL